MTIILQSDFQNLAPGANPEGEFTAIYDATPLVADRGGDRVVAFDNDGTTGTTAFIDFPGTSIPAFSIAMMITPRRAFASVGEWWHGRAPGKTGSGLSFPDGTWNVRRGGTGEPQTALSPVIPIGAPFIVQISCSATQQRARFTDPSGVVLANATENNPSTMPAYTGTQLGILANSTNGAYDLHSFVVSDAWELLDPAVYVAPEPEPTVRRIGELIYLNGALL